MGKTFSDFINNPKNIVQSKGFNLAAFGFKILLLFFIAAVGVTISGFKYNSFSDIMTWAYWLMVGVTLFEQLFANDAAYQYGIFFFSAASEDLKNTDNKADCIINGVYDEEGNEIQDEKGKPTIIPITQASESEYTDLAVIKLNREEKLNHVTKQVVSLIGFFQNKIDMFTLMKHNKFFFPRTIKVKKFFGKPFWRKKTALEYCEQKIKEGKLFLSDNEKILAIPSKNIKGYRELDLNDLITNQDESVETQDESQYFMRNRKKERAKSVGLKSLTKLGISLIGIGILFNALSDVDTKTIWTIVIIVIIQLFSGMKEAYKHVKHIILINSHRRYKALQKIYNMIPSIKKEAAAKALELQKIKDAEPIEEVKPQLEEIKQEIIEVIEEEKKPPVTPEQIDEIIEKGDIPNASYSN